MPCACGCWRFPSGARPGRRRRAKPTSSAGNASPYRSATRRWPKFSNGSNSRRDITSSIIATPCRGIGGISFSKADAPVREVLDEALRGTRLEYSIDDDTIVIRGRSGGERLRPRESPGQGRQRTCDGHGRRAARGREHPDPGDRHGSRVGVRRRILDPHARGPRQPDLLPHRLRLANASLGTDQTGQAGAGRTGDRKRRGDRHLHPQEGELHGFGHDHHVGPAGPRE